MHTFEQGHLQRSDRNTIAAVADELHLTASAVSMQLAALEREVGLTLTERQGRGVVLTPAGEVLAEHGRKIFDLVSVAEMEVHALRQGESGSYKIAAFPTAARTYLADSWRQLRDGPRAGPALAVSELEPDAAIAALLSGEAGFQPKIVAEASDYSVQLQLVAAGMPTPSPAECNYYPWTRPSHDTTSH